MAEVTESSTLISRIISPIISVYGYAYMRFRVCIYLCFISQSNSHSSNVEWSSPTPYTLVTTREECRAQKALRSTQREKVRRAIGHTDSFRFGVLGHSNTIVTIALYEHACNEQSSPDLPNHPPLRPLAQVSALSIGSYHAHTHKSIPSHHREQRSRRVARTTFISQLY